ncbi:hypothetical protein Glove_391g13 [Diversispora epigaea]|uniref:HAT C-terminal dimerisation domain-containing protein n=1 Tax=Diversispora epigaea TaxID=1348612 RepID=A0A397H2F3_9GLOM|nr:hypothetical protein Glove_391g13 [Diversispora epigaea]
MPPFSTITVISCAREFSDHFFADNGKLMCRFCDHSINFQTKNTITAHIGSKTHIRNKEEKENQQIKKRQPTIQTLINTSETKKTIINNLVEAFVMADIPLEKVDKLQKWLCENCREGGFIPKSDTLRREYLPKLFENHVDQLKEYFCGKRVSIIVDETTDSRARSVVNILFSYNGITKLTHVDYLESVNNCTIGQLIIQILVQWAIPFDLPLLIASDLAAYMKKCYRDVLKSIMPQLIHLPCLAHILNLIGEAWASINHFQIVHQLLADIKQTFVFCKSRRARYISYLYRHGQSNGSIEIYLAFIQENAQQFVADLDFFQQETKPIFPFIEQRLQQLEAQIIMGKTMTNFGSTVNLVLQKLNTPLISFCPVFQQAYHVAYKKLENHVLQHPARSLFKAIQIFDPRFLTLTAANRDIYSYQIIRELVNPSICLIQEWSIYININLNTVEFTDLNEFWDKVSLQLPFLEKIARNYIWLPISSCAVERSFSAYNKILDDDRLYMLPKSQIIWDLGCQNAQITSIWDLGFGISAKNTNCNLGFGIWDLGFRQKILIVIWDLGFGIWDFGIWDFGIWILNLGGSGQI